MKHIKSLCKNISRVAEPWILQHDYEISLLFGGGFGGEGSDIKGENWRKDISGIYWKSHLDLKVNKLWITLCFSMWDVMLLPRLAFFIIQDL